MNRAQKSERNKMNKLLKELADQAGFVRFTPDEDPHTPIDWSSDYSHELAEFARLIVAKCANICVSEAQGYGVAFGEHCAIVINEQFGVE